MNTNLQTWSYESSEVRTIQKNGEPWWVLADVCKVLDLSNPSKVADRLEPDEKANFELGLLSLFVYHHKYFDNIRSFQSNYLWVLYKINDVHCTT